MNNAAGSRFRKCLEDNRTYVIAEVGVNHNGILSTAHDLIDAAAECGADAVKFQTFQASELVNQDLGQAPYQRKGKSSLRSQFQMLRELELSFSSHYELRQHADDRGLEFLSTPYDLDALKFLRDEIKVPVIKIASADITYGQLLFAAGQSKCDIILSTGMATMDEVQTALSLVRSGAQESGRVVGIDEPIIQKPGQSIRRGPADPEIVVMQCTSNYPSAPHEAHLKVLETFKHYFKVRVGYSDHTQSEVAAVVAVALGSVAVERHFTLDTSQVGPDHAASLDPAGMRRYVQRIREAEQLLGTSVKTPQLGESVNIWYLRRSLYAARDLKSGDLVQTSDIVARRPGDGLCASNYLQLIGSRCRRDIVRGEPFLEGDFG